MGHLKENFDNVKKNKNALLKELADLCHKHGADINWIPHHERFAFGDFCPDYDEIFIEKDGILFLHFRIFVNKITNKLIIEESIPHILG